MSEDRKGAKGRQKGADDRRASDDAGEGRPANAKSRALVGVLGLVAPGLGHAFVGHARRGAAWAVSPAVAVVLLASVLPSSTSAGRVVAICGAASALLYLASIVDAVVLSPARHRALSPAGVFATLAAPLVLSIGVALFLRSSVVQAFKVPSGSMIPTIMLGDHLFVDMRAHAPRRGEAIVFRYPERPSQEFLKRVVAGPGDELVVRGGKLTINGWQVPSCRVGSWSYDDESSKHTGDVFVEFLERSAYLVFFESGASPPDEVQGPYRVTDGEWFVVGDNRFNSHDSRMWYGGAGGGVPTAKVRGRATTIWSSTVPGRFGVDLAADPVPPAPELAAPLAACLASRPPVDKATPPARP